MNAQKATYWIALGLLTYAFTGEYQRGAFPVFHRLASYGNSRVCRLATNAERTFALARLIVGRPALRADDLVADARPLAIAGRLAEERAEMIQEQGQDQAQITREEAHNRADQLRDRIRKQILGQKERIRAQQEMVRAQIELQRAELQRSRKGMRLSNLVQVRVRDRMMVATPEICAQSGIRTALDSMADLSDDKQDSSK